MVSALEVFRERLPYRPYCTDDLAAGLRIRSAVVAAQKKYIQPNGPHAISWLIFDVDRPEAGASWIDADLLPPTLIVVTRENGHAHLLWGLVTPVCRTPAGRRAPLHYAAAIERAYTVVLDADPGYSHLVTHNPLHDTWETREVGGLYTLAKLAGSLDLDAPSRANLPTIGLGRNCALFDALRKWAYVAVRRHWRPGGDSAWQREVLAQAQTSNRFVVPLPRQEVASTAGSVAKWVWRHCTPTGLTGLIARTHRADQQAQRGRASGVARFAASTDGRASARLLRRSGLSLRQIAAELNVSLGTAHTWCA